MSATTRDLLSQLLEVTPPPPSGNDVEAMLAAFEDIIARRAEILDQLEIPLQFSDTERPLVREIEQRDAAWQTALSAALTRVGEQRVGADQLRAYAPSL